MDYSPQISTGINGLDEILQSGFIPGRAYLVRGGPGTGKTTLGVHFLARGLAQQERCMFINMGESEQQIRANAATIGMDLENVIFLDFSPTADFFTELQTYDVFSPAEVEREPTTQRITQEVQTLKPQRVFLDAMTHFRYFASDQYQFRKQIHAFLRFLTEQGATVLFTSEEAGAEQDTDLQFMSDGIINLENRLGVRTLTVSKFRGSGFKGGRHTLRLNNNGMQVFPRLQPDLAPATFDFTQLSAGIPELDELLHGGIERSMITILSGPTGVGKTTLGMVYMKEAAGRGERSAVYTFEEWEDILRQRSTSVNIPVDAMVKRGTLVVTQIDPLQYTSDEFAHLVRQDVDERNTKIVMIDSIAGYKLSLRGEDIVGSLYALCKYLQSRGVTVILINELESITGEFKATDIGISYIADNIIFLRYMEYMGEIRRVIGVLKKRLSSFEKTLREFEITHSGIKIGKPLTDLRGILTGTPEYVSKEEKS